MANSTVSPFQGACPAPFMDEKLFGQDGGCKSTCSFTFHVALELTCNSHFRTILRTHSPAARTANMLLALSSNILGILRQFRDIQQHRRMAECCGPNITNLHAAKLHCAANTEDTESLLVSMSHHCGHDDLSRFYHPSGSKSRAMLRRNYAKRHVLIYGLRLEWRDDCCWRS
jgi:hypothetical protein